MVNVDVRIIAATNRNLGQAVAEGRFREDLFYRLHIIPIRTPSLRERPEDIPLLVETFLVHFCAKHRRRPCMHMSDGAIHACQRYPWPGNVRQLRNMIERLVVVCRTTEVAEADLPEFIALHERVVPEFVLRAGMTIAEAERMLIRKTLALVTSNREEAARLLGISRRTLHYKLKRYGLSGESELAR
jgi:DNA-binding NtrC family response regulator